MPDAYRVTIRLSPDLYAQLEARGSQGQPLAAIVRDALADYLARQPAQPGDTNEPALTLAAMAARVAELHVQMQDTTARLEALAADRQPPAATLGSQTAAKRQSESHTGAAIPLTGARGNLRRRIVALLQEHPEGLGPVQTRELLGIDKDLGNTMKAMARDGLLRRVETGWYVATAPS
jgi:hypothetical protein